MTANPPFPPAPSGVHPRPGWIRRLIHSLLALGALSAAPAVALEQFVLALPELDTGITIDLGELETAVDLVEGNSDLAELARAGGGATARQVVRLFQSPLPGEIQAIDPAVGDPLLQQVLAGLSNLIDVEDGSIDTTGQALALAVHRARLAGQPTVLGLLRQLPGSRATVDLNKVLLFSNRLRRNQALARRLVSAVPPQAVDATAQPQGPAAVRSGLFQLDVDHRPEPMQVAWFRPDGPARGATIVISHGLWDSPESFLGWAQYLASHGHVVLLPEHQGSDKRQQSAMVAGVPPPPGAAELRLRPVDVSALLTSLDDQPRADLGPLNVRNVGVVGHSWGAVTTLQLAGLRPGRATQAERCEDQWDPSAISAGPSSARCWPMVRLLSCPMSASGRWWRSAHRPGFCLMPNPARGSRRQAWWSAAHVIGWCHQALRPSPPSAWLVLPARATGLCWPRGAIISTCVPRIPLRRQPWAV